MPVNQKDKSVNKKVIIVALVAVTVAIVIGGYFIFRTPNIVVYTSRSSFLPNFLQCSPGELQEPDTGTGGLIITVLGIENGNCHYTGKLIDKYGVLLSKNSPDTINCKVPMKLITTDLFNRHLFDSKNYCVFISK